MRKIFILLSITLLLFSCSKKYDRQESERYMTTGNVEYVKEFPVNIELSQPQRIEMEALNVTGFQVLDTLMALKVKGDGFLAFSTMKNPKVLGRFLNVGNSEEELIFPPDLATGFVFYQLGDTLLADVFDQQKGRILTMDVNQSLKTGKLVLKSISKGLANNDFNVVRLTDGRYFVKELLNGDTQQTRMIRDLKTGKNFTPKILARLNTASVVPGEDFNILSTITKVSKDDRIIEMPIGLNYINIYKIDGSFAKTICVGDKLDDIDEIMNTDRWNRLYTFSNISVFDKCFGVVQINEEEKSYQSKREKLPSILLFSLEGKPLASIKMKRHITSFDIDFKNGYLYTLDNQTEEFLKYKIPQELKTVLDR